MNNIPSNAGIVDKYIIYPIANIFVPYAYKIGITPNIITSITLFLRILMLYNLYYRQNYELLEQRSYERLERRQRRRQKRREKKQNRQYF